MLTKTASIKRLALGFLTVAGVLLASTGAAHATTPSLGGSSGGVPEIDPGTLTSSLALLCGGMLMLTDKIRRK